MEGILASGQWENWHHSAQARLHQYHPRAPEAVRDIASRVPMPPKDGEPADADDIWLRNVTDKKHVRADGKPTSNAFTGRAISPRAKGRPWDHELSGRLLSFLQRTSRPKAVNIA